MDQLPAIDDTWVPNGEGEYPIHTAIWNGDIKAIQSLIRSRPGCLQTLANEGMSTLHIAVLKGQLLVVETILQAWPEGIRAKDAEGWNAFHFATRENEQDILGALMKVWPQGIQQRVGPEERDVTTNGGGDADKAVEFRDGQYCIHLAAAQGDVALISLLCDAWPQGASLREPDNGWLPLHIAITEGHVEAVRRLLSAWPEGIRTRSASGALPLHLACQQGNLSIIELLLTASPEALHEKESMYGWYAVHFAADKNRDDVVQLLVDRSTTTTTGGDGMNAIVKCETSTGALPLHLAAKKGHAMTVQVLIRAWKEGAAVKERGSERYPLHFAAENGDVDTIQLLLDVFPAVVAVPDGRGSTPIDLATKGEHHPAVVALSVATSA